MNKEEAQQAAAHRPGEAPQFYFDLPSCAPGVCAISFGRNLMQISHDAGAQAKIAILYGGGFFLTALVANGFLYGHIGSMLIVAICVCAAPLFFLCYKKRIKSLATKVQIQQDSLICTINGVALRVPKEKISAVADTGSNSAPHLIIVSLHDGRELEFFPSRSFGSFHAGELKKRLKEWLNSSTF